MTANCMGGCGCPVTETDKWCSSCWPNLAIKQEIVAERMRGAATSQDLRRDLYEAAWRLKSTRNPKQRVAELETISHLTFVLTHSETTNTEKDTPCTSQHSKNPSSSSDPMSETEFS